jgi:hypothetical protein
MNLYSFIISIPHATIKEHNSTTIYIYPYPIMHHIGRKKWYRPWNTNASQERKKQNLFLHVITF